MTREELEKRNTILHDMYVVQIENEPTAIILRIFYTKADALAFRNKWIEEEYQRQVKDLTKFSEYKYKPSITKKLIGEGIGIVPVNFGEIVEDYPFFDDDF